ncbi:ankyrin repeat domain-containing protein [Wolbachia endosymbiont of Pentidionis agamae]|uniref:ankyrin repeat domain-containing protein n=1 Tax=Wolbachia endosymbiont of Pentidionis agamae TaxID=3110435 RepID=UPI002FD4B947
MHGSDNKMTQSTDSVSTKYPSLIDEEGHTNSNPHLHESTNSPDSRSIETMSEQGSPQSTSSPEVVEGASSNSPRSSNSSFDNVSVSELPSGEVGNDIKDTLENVLGYVVVQVDNTSNNGSKDEEKQNALGNQLREEVTEEVTNEDVKKFEWLLGEGVDVETHLLNAAKIGKLGIVKYISEKELVEKNDYAWKNALQYAAKNGKFDIVKYIGEKELVERDDYAWKDALQCASKNSNKDIAEYIEQHISEALKEGEEVTIIVEELVGNVIVQDNNTSESQYEDEEERKTLEVQAPKVTGVQHLAEPKQTSSKQSHVVQPTTNGNAKTSQSNNVPKELGESKKPNGQKIAYGLAGALLAAAAITILVNNALWMVALSLVVAAILTVVLCALYNYYSEKKSSKNEHQDTKTSNVCAEPLKSNEGERLI